MSTGDAYDVIFRSFNTRSRWRQVAPPKDRQGLSVFVGDRPLGVSGLECNSPRMCSKVAGSWVPACTEQTALGLAAWWGCVEPMVGQWQGRNCGVSNVIATLHQAFRRTAASRVDVIASSAQTRAIGSAKAWKWHGSPSKFCQAEPKGHCVASLAVRAMCCDMLGLGESG